MAEEIQEMIFIHSYLGGKREARASAVAQWVKVPADKPNNMNSIPRTHRCRERGDASLSLPNAKIAGLHHHTQLWLRLTATGPNPSKRSTVSSFLVLSLAFCLPFPGRLWRVCTPMPELPTHCRVSNSRRNGCECVSFSFPPKMKGM